MNRTVLAIGCLVALAACGSDMYEDNPQPNPQQNNPRATVYCDGQNRVYLYGDALVVIPNS